MALHLASFCNRGLGNSEKAFWTARISFRFYFILFFSMKVAKAHAH